MEKKGDFQKKKIKLIMKINVMTQWMNFKKRFDTVLTNQNGGRMRKLLITQPRGKIY